MLSISHDIAEEDIGAKLKWFGALSVSERLEALSEMYELAVQLNPELKAGVDDRPPHATVQVLELPRG